MSTPKQATKIIQTPFGEAKIHDYRGHDSEETQGDRASIWFEELTINRKEYGSKGFSLTAHRYAGQDLRYYINESSYNRITDAASKKLEEFFIPGGTPIDELKPYLEPLDAGDARNHLKARMAYEAFSGLYDVTRKFEGQGKSWELVAEILDELLAEATAKRQDGVSYADIYFKRDDK